MGELIGRAKEKIELEEALASDKPELIALIGRRRVGKTYLVRETYTERINFELTGIQHGNRDEQIQAFMFSMGQYLPEYRIRETPENWIAAFNKLGQALTAIDRSKKKVIFLDELPWLGTRKSGFIKGLGYFWNSWASKMDIVVVICGSAASWIIDKVINDRGGLHNRVTRLISLAPFSLAETEEYCATRGLSTNRYQILQLHITIGGIPMYLDQLKPHLSAIQNINAICFQVNGYLRQEFGRLFESLYANPDRHIELVRALASKRKGLTRKEILDIVTLSNGGALTKILAELKASGFISFYGAFKKKERETLYRLTDAYSLFYLTYIEPLGAEPMADFTQLSDLPSWKAWSGYAFENVCLVHYQQIRKALGISGVSTIRGTFIARPTDGIAGTQIDLLIDRRDDTINLCEAKFSTTPYNVSKTVAENLMRKKQVFQYHTKTHKSLFVTLISTFGMVPSSPGRYAVDQVVTMDDLFQP